MLGRRLTFESLIHMTVMVIAVWLCSWDHIRVGAWLPFLLDFWNVPSSSASVAKLSGSEVWLLENLSRCSSPLHRALS